MSEKGTNAPVRANFEVGFDNGLSKKNPIHECITIAAFIRSKVALPPQTTYNDLDQQQWEYFRGLIWNDDPSCYLFNDKEDNNHEFSTGAKWLWDYEWGAANCMIQRSHFGDLQFLHGMATKGDEKPEATRARLVSWLEVMYKLACGDQGVSEDDKLSHHLAQHFNDKTNPNGGTTLRDLLLADTPNYNKSNVPMRALGSCLHIIQDSFAIGHTQRRLRNPHDLDERDKDGFLRFKPGTYGKWGSVLVFHTYSGQSGPRHQHYDGLEGEPLPSPKDINSFNHILGSRSAIKACIKMLNFYADKTPWDDGVRQYFEGKLFRLDPEARPSDSFVDEPEEPPPSLVLPREDDLVFEKGLQRKSAQLEDGISEGTDHTSMRHRRSSRALLLHAFIVLFCLAMLFSHWILRNADAI